MSARSHEMGFAPTSEPVNRKLTGRSWSRIWDEEVALEWDPGPPIAPDGNRVALRRADHSWVILDRTSEGAVDRRRTARAGPSMGNFIAVAGRVRGAPHPILLGIGRPAEVSGWNCGRSSTHLGPSFIPSLV